MPGSTVNPSPLFRLPLLALGPYVLTGVMLGCAQGAYESVVGARAHAQRHEHRRCRSTPSPGDPDQGRGGQRAHRHRRDDHAARLRACHGGRARRREPKHADKVRYRRDAFFSVRLCLEAVDILMGIAGSGGLYSTGTMQRLFRDAHAANAHVMFSPDLQGACSASMRSASAGPPPLM